jgi:hypothetical protein
MYRAKITTYPDYHKLGSRGMVRGVSSEFSFKELHQIVQTKAWSPVLYSKNIRKKSNFQESQIVAIDIDENLPSADAKRRLDDLGLRYSITFTRNHQKEKRTSSNHVKPACDRYRAIIPLERLVHSMDEYEKVVGLVVKYIFPEADEACTDAARAFFPSSGECKSIFMEQGDSVNIDNLKSKNIVDRVIEQYPLSQKMRDFLSNPQKMVDANEWNISLNLLAYALGTEGESLQNIITLAEALAPDPLNKDDLGTIRSGHKSGHKIHKDGGGKSPCLKQLCNVIKDEMSQFLLVQEGGDTINILEKFNAAGEVRYTTCEMLIFAIIKALEKVDKFKSITQANNLAQYYRAMTPPLLEEPPLVSFTSDSCLSFVKIDKDLSQQECPHFKEFLSRCSEPDAVAAYIYSVFERKSDKQQYLWLYGDGQDGKGVLGRLIERALKGTYCTDSSNGSARDAHATSAYLGKRVLCYPDNSNRNLPRTDEFKMITGGDAIKINKKYCQPFTKRLDIKVLVLSNDLPALSSQKSDIRRAIISRVSPFTGRPDSRYEDRLWSEFGAILNYCRSKYQELTTDHSPIQFNTISTMELAKSNEEDYEMIFDEFFSCSDKDALLKPYDFKSAAIEECRRMGVTWKDFRAWVERNKVKEKRVDGKRWFKGVKIKGSHSSLPVLPFGS